MPFRIQVLLGVEICAAAVTLIRPFWGLLFLIFLTFMRPQDDRPNMAELHIPMVMTWTLIAATVMRLNMFMSRVGVAIRYLWLFASLYVLMALASWVNGWTPYSRYQLDDSIAVFIVSALILIWVSNEKRMMAFLYTMVASGLYYVQMVLRNPSFMREEIGQAEFQRLDFRHAINFGNPNFLAILMVIMTFLALGLMTGENRFWMKILLAASVCGYLYVFLRCQSRGATLGMVVGMLFFWLMQKRKLLVASLMGISLTLLLLFVAPASYLDRLKTIVNYQEDASATGRLEMWGISREVIASNPVLGMGPGNFEPTYPNMSQHNAYLQVASEVGVPALLLYIALLLSGYRSLWIAQRLASPDNKNLPQYHKLAQGMFCALAGITVQGFFTGFAFREFVYITLAISYCLRDLVQNAEAVEEAAEPEAVVAAEYVRA